MFFTLPEVGLVNGIDYKQLTIVETSEKDGRRGQSKIEEVLG
jgi:hypothetical protein